MSLKQCCATGSLHTGTPTGTLGKVHGLDCYVAEAPSGSPKGIVVIIPDAFGLSLPNNRILADEYAKKGDYTVYLPGFYGYELPVEIQLSIKAFSATGLWNQLYKLGHAIYLIRHAVPFMIWARRGWVYPKVMKFFRDLQKNEAANLPVGAAGFCWGGKYVTELCWDHEKTADGKRLIDCGFIAHPSMLKYPQDIEMVTLPLAVAASEHDMQMSVENAQKTKEVLTAKTAKTKDHGIEHEFVLYEGAHHGFAVRADPNEEHEAAQGKKAEAQALSWFGRWFTNPPPS